MSTDFGNLTLQQVTPTPVVVPGQIRRMEFIPGDVSNPTQIIIYVGAKDTQGLWRNDINFDPIIISDDHITVDPATGLPIAPVNGSDPNAGRKIPATRLFELCMQSVTPTTPTTNALGIANQTIRAILAKYLRAVGKLP